LLGIALLSSGKLCRVEGIIIYVESWKHFTYSEDIFWQYFLAVFVKMKAILLILGASLAAHAARIRKNYVPCMKVTFVVLTWQ
jgi:hypothetical protein